MRSYPYLRRLGSRIRPLAVAVLVLPTACVASFASGAPAGAPTPALAARLDAVVKSQALKGASVAAMVARVSDGEVLYERNASTALVPASNAKILTAIAALASFGPAFQFETPVLADRVPDALGAVSFLAIQGAGDPVLNSEDWWKLASELRLRGLRRIEGDLILDDLAFDATRWNPALGATSSRAYHAPVGALNANYGSFSVTVAAGAKPGDPVEAVLDPPLPYLLLDNRARTGSRKERRSLIVDRKAAGDREKVVVTGALRAGDAPKVFYRSVLDPTLYAAAVLRMQLEAVGIEVGGKTRIGSVPSGSVELIRFEGRPMREIVSLFMKYSNNMVAETLVKAMGAREGDAPGSWETGTSAVKSALRGQGIQSSEFKLVDGSGLAYQNRVTARGLVEALRAAYNSFAYGPEFVSSLPISALDGTLEKRAAAAKGEVRAKTGLLNGITALSGYARVGSRDADVLVFSVLANGYKVNDGKAMAALDRFAAELLR